MVYFGGMVQGCEAVVLSRRHPRFTFGVVRVSGSFAFRGRSRSCSVTAVLWVVLCWWSLSLCVAGSWP
jgi:hypothetical protein